MSCDLGWAATTTRERGRNERVIETLREWERDMGWAATIRRWRGREAETREWLREWGRGREWLRVIQISKSEARVSFEGLVLNLFNMLQTTPYRGGTGWNDVVLRLKQGNRLNRSWFIELDGRAAVRTGPCFFRIERSLTLNGPWNWTVHGFPSWTIWSGPGLTTLIGIGGDKIWVFTLHPY